MPRDAQSLVTNLATASCDMLFNLIKVPPEYACIHSGIVGRVASYHHGFWVRPIVRKPCRRSKVARIEL
jgi:hypothetical protein